MSDNPKNDHSGWDRGWDEHKRQQLKRQAKLTLAQKLQWLEEMQELASKLAEGSRIASKEKPTPPSASG